MTSRWKNDKVYQAMVDMYSYNFDVELVESVLEDVKKLYEKDPHTYEHVSRHDTDWMDEDSGLNYVWGMLVLMFGEYGTSPRTGWLLVSKDLIDFLEDFVEDLKSEF